MCILRLYPLQFFEYSSISHTVEDNKTDLDRLPVRPVNVYADNNVLELGIGALHRIVIDVDDITESLHAISYKLPKCLQVLGTRRRDKDV